MGTWICGWLVCSITHVQRLTTLKYVHGDINSWANSDPKNSETLIPSLTMMIRHYFTGSLLCIWSYPVNETIFIKIWLISQTKRFLLLLQAFNKGKSLSIKIIPLLRNLQKNKDPCTPILDSVITVRQTLMPWMDDQTIIRTILSRYLSSDPTVVNGSIFRLHPLLSSSPPSPDARSKRNRSRLVSIYKHKETHFTSSPRLSRRPSTLLHHSIIHHIKNSLNPVNGWPLTCNP